MYPIKKRRAIIFKNRKMKKSIVLSIMLCAMGFTALAQTNFRHISFREAVAAAKQENKLVFIDFYTDWCGPCKMMARDVFPQKKVGEFFNEKFVCVKLNAEKEGKELATRFVVKAYPTFLVLDSDEKVRLEIKGAMDADAFIAKVEAGLDPEQSPERMAQRYNSGERTPELVDRYAYYNMEQGKENEGFQIINDYFNSLTDTQRVEAANAFIYTRYTMTWDDPKAQFMVAHRNEFDASVQKAILDRMSRLYHAAVISYFSGYMFRENKFKMDEYEELKRNIQCLDQEKAKPYAPMFRMIESRLKDDDATFWSVCKSEYDNLAQTDRDLLIMNLTRLIATNDVAILKDISQFVRSRLKEMSPNTIMMTGRVLDSIESKLSAK